MFSSEERERAREAWAEHTTRTLDMIEQALSVATHEAQAAQAAGNDTAAAMHVQSWATMQLTAQLLRCTALLDVGLQGIEAQLARRYEPIHNLSLDKLRDEVGEI
jgi:hypothetical protein